MVRIVLFSLLCALYGLCQGDVLKYESKDYQFPFMDPTLSWDKRVDDLVGRLTLDEISPQTVAADLTPEIPRLGIKPYAWDTECIRGQAHTNTTAFPHSIGLSATFR